MAKKVVDYHQTSHFVSFEEDPRCGGQTAVYWVKNMYCSGCKGYVSEYAKFCPHCGEKFTGIVDTRADEMRKEIKAEERKLTSMQKKITSYDKAAIRAIERQESHVEQLKDRLYEYQCIPVK